MPSTAVCAGAEQCRTLRGDLNGDPNGDPSRLSTWSLDGPRKGTQSSGSSNVVPMWPLCALVVPMWPLSGLDTALWSLCGPYMATTALCLAALASGFVYTL